MFNDLFYIYSAILGERWKGITMLYCGQQFLHYQQNEQSQKKTQHISVSAITFSGYTQSQKIVIQRIKIIVIKKMKMSSQGHQSWLRSPMSSQACPIWLWSPMSSQGSQIWLRSAMSSQGSQAYLRSTMSSQGSQIWLRSHMSTHGSQTWLSSPMSSQDSQTWLRSPLPEQGDPYVRYIGRVWRNHRGGQNPWIEKRTDNQLQNDKQRST